MNIFQQKLFEEDCLTKKILFFIHSSFLYTLFFPNKSAFLETGLLKTKKVYKKEVFFFLTILCSFYFFVPFSSVVFSFLFVFFTFLFLFLLLFFLLFCSFYFCCFFYFFVSRFFFTFFVSFLLFLCKVFSICLKILFCFFFVEDSFVFLLCFFLLSFLFNNKKRVCFHIT